LSFTEYIFLPETYFSSMVLPKRTESPVQISSVWKAARTTLFYFDFSFLLIKPRPFKVVILYLPLSSKHYFSVLFSTSSSRVIWVRSEDWIHGGGETKW